MRRTLLNLVLVVALLSGGCASFQYAVSQVPQRTQDMWEDPIRREHFQTQWALTTLTGVAVLGCAIALPGIGFFLCPTLGTLFNFGAYEFVLEPISKDRVKEGKPSLVGPYWERGPQDGEVFKCNILMQRCDIWPYEIQR